MNFKMLLIMMVGVICLSVASYAAFDPSTAAPAELRAQAEQGDAQAQFTLGANFYTGEGVKRSHKEAVKWLRLAAEQGLVEAQYNLGLIYKKLAPEYINSFSGANEITRDYVEGYAWLSCAAIQGLNLADDGLSDCMERMAASDIVKGKQLAETYATKHLQTELERIESLRLPFGQKLVRDIKLKIYDELDGPKKMSIPREQYGLYAPSKGTLTPLYNSFEECLKKAEAGDAPAMFELANRYETGDGILKNADKSKQWLINSAERGYMPAIEKSGILKYAFKLYKQNNADAALYLSEHAYSRGKGKYAYDNESAQEFYGESIFLSERANSDFFLYKAVSSIDYLIVAAQLRNAEAMYKLAQHYFKNADYENAYLWFGSSAEVDPRSAFFAGFLRGMGWGCPKNYEAGFLYLLSAYGHLAENSSSVTFEMLKLAHDSASKTPQPFEALWLESYSLCHGTLLNIKASLPVRILSSGENQMIVALWNCLVDLNAGLTEKSVAQLSNLQTFGLDVSDTVALAKKALGEQEARRAEIRNQITEKKAALESIYAQLKSELDEKKAQKEAAEAAQRHRYEKEQRKEQRLVLSLLGGALIAGLIFIYGIYRAVRKFLRWRKSNPRIKKPLRIWQKILSGWIVWGVLVFLYAVLFEEDIKVGPALFPPTAVTITYGWWRWVKNKSNTRASADFQK